MRRALGLACVIAGILPAAAYGQVVESPFTASYSVRDLGSPPGVPTRYGRMSSQMANFLDQTGGLWARGALTGKVGSAMSSTATPATSR